MTDGVLVALIVSGTSLATVGINRAFSLADRRATQASLGTVEKKLDGVLADHIQSARDQGTAEGFNAGVQQERDAK